MIYVVGRDEEGRLLLALDSVTEESGFVDFLDILTRDEWVAP